MAKPRKFYRKETSDGEKTIATTKWQKISFLGTALKEQKSIILDISKFLHHQLLQVISEQ